MMPFLLNRRLQCEITWRCTLNSQWRDGAFIAPSVTTARCTSLKCVFIHISSANIVELNNCRCNNLRWRMLDTFGEFICFNLNSSLYVCTRQTSTYAEMGTITHCQYTVQSSSIIVCLRRNRYLIIMTWAATHLLLLTFILLQIETRQLTIKIYENKITTFPLYCVLKNIIEFNRVGMIHQPSTIHWIRDSFRFCSRTPQPVMICRQAHWLCSLRHSCRRKSSNSRFRRNSSLRHSLFPTHYSISIVWNDRFCYCKREWRRSMIASKGTNAHMAYSLALVNLSRSGWVTYWISLNHIWFAIRAIACGE